MNKKIQQDKSLCPLSLLTKELQQQPRLTPLINTFVERALEGSLVYERSLEHSINRAIQLLDQKINRQLSKLLHHPLFSQFEGRWRGLNKLVHHTATCSNLKVKLLSCNLTELHQDFSAHEELDHTQLYKKIYQAEFGTPGGQPYASIVLDHEFDHSSENLNLLNKLAKLGSAAFCPIISAAAPSLLGLNTWQDIDKPRQLEKITFTNEYLIWNHFRQSDEARFIYLCMPRSLARPVYSHSPSNTHAFNFNEFTEIEQAKNSNNYCWMNSAFNLASLMAEAFSKHGWCINIRGSESGGKINHLPLYVYKNNHGEFQYQCPTEISISDQREAELSKLGLMPLCYYKNTDYAVFFGAESVQQSKVYDKTEATENARISARLPYIMATSRFAHYLKIMARDKIGSFMSSAEINDQLNRWILNYVNANKDSKQELKAKYPLAEARIEVTESAGRTGHFEAVAWLRPWLQMEELSTSLRLVAKIPQRRLS